MRDLHPPEPLTLGRGRNIPCGTGSLIGVLLLLHVTLPLCTVVWHQPKSGDALALKVAIALAIIILCHRLSDICLLYTSPSPRDGLLSRMPSSA